MKFILIFFVIAIYHKIMSWREMRRPILKDPTKKPTIMYISFEDEIANVLKFMYRYLYYNENKEVPDGTPNDLTMLSSEDLKNYVMGRLGANGFEVVLMRVAP